MTPDITQLLSRARAGEDGASDRLYEAVYAELRQLARAQLRQYGRRTLHTTALVHEAYVRLCKSVELGLEDRHHFFALSARAMRNVLVDHFRAVRAVKRGGDFEFVSLEAQDVPLEQRGDVVLALDDALHRLAELDEGLAKVVELKFFGGFTELEIGAMLGLTDRAIRGRWQKAKAWLALELDPE